MFGKRGAPIGNKNAQGNHGGPNKTKQTSFVSRNKGKMLAGASLVLGGYVANEIAKANSEMDARLSAENHEKTKMRAKADSQIDVDRERRMLAWKAFDDQSKAMIKAAEESQAKLERLRRTQELSDRQYKDQVPSQKGSKLW